MFIQRSNLVSTSEVILYQAPAGHETVFVEVVAKDTSAIAKTVTFRVKDPTDDILMEMDLAVTLNGTAKLNGKIFLRDGSRLTAITSTGQVRISVGGDEDVESSSVVPHTWTYMGDWVDNVNYSVNNVIKYDSQAYISKADNNLNKIPGVDPDWDLFQVPFSSGERNTIYVNLADSPYTYTKPSWLRFVVVEMVGGGGGSGGRAATGVSQVSVGVGGGGGGYTKKRILTAAIGATETVTIGAGGLAGAAGNNTGGTGGTTSFGAHCTATGGVGGGSGAAGNISSASGGVGGAGASGDLNIDGGRGTGSVARSESSVYSVAIHGGLSRFSGQMSHNAAGALYGGGGAGQYSWPSTAAAAGNAGAAGILIIHEYE